MAGNFPTEFPAQGMQAALQPILHGSGFNGQFALGTYDLLGYALYQAFGDVHYALTAESPEHITNMIAQAPPEVQQALHALQSNPELMSAEGAIPDWIGPAVQYLVQLVLTKLLQRFATQANPTLFGRPVMMCPPPNQFGAMLPKLNQPRIGSKQLPPQTGGAFPERHQGQPTGTGLHTQSHPQVSAAQAGGPQSQPSDKMQQPTGPVPQQHPSVPTSSKSPQMQANTADPRLQHEARPLSPEVRAGSPSSQPGGPVGPVVNAPGVPGTPGTAAGNQPLGPNPPPGGQQSSPQVSPNQTTDPNNPQATPKK